MASRAIFELQKVASDTSQTLYYRNREVCRLPRYGVKLKPEVGENTVTVWRAGALACLDPLSSSGLLSSLVHCTKETRRSLGVSPQARAKWKMGRQKASKLIRMPLVVTDPLAMQRDASG